MTHFGLAEFFENMSVGGAYGGADSSDVTENLLCSTQWGLAALTSSLIVVIHCFVLFGWPRLGQMVPL